jgi:hypothetical protein
MPPKAAPKWDDKKLASLCTSIFSVLGTDSLNQDQKESVVALMKKDGYEEISWNGIR